MSGRHAIARRIILRLDPCRTHHRSMAIAAHLAAAFEAELAARLIADTRYESAPSILAAGRVIETHTRRAATTLRQATEDLAEGENAAWSFEVVRCSGNTARDAELKTDDVVGIELPRFEISASDLRDEIDCGLSRSRAVLLFPASSTVSAGPVVAIIGRPPPTSHLTEESERIADALGVPLKLLDRSGALQTTGDMALRSAADFAITIRTLGATLATIDPEDPLAAELLSRPRLLRELATPLLLLRSAA